jgi:SAM-dependent methyltransferase
MIAVDFTAWSDRWEAQQDQYMTDREERFTVMFDALEAVVGSGRMTVLDVGCGPGSLSVRLLGRFPEATVVGVDVDPLLLMLARGAHGDQPRLRFASADLRDPGWIDRLDLDGPVDAALSTTALHWLSLPSLERLYGHLARLLRPGGVFLDGDHCRFPGQPGIEKAAALVAEGARARRLRDTEDAESWEAWWRAVRAEPAFADAIRQRDEIGHGHHEDRARIGEEDHHRRLRAAGFSEAATIWQQGDDRILAAIR